MVLPLSSSRAGQDGFNHQGLSEQCPIGVVLAMVIDRNQAREVVEAVLATLWERRPFKHDLAQMQGEESELWNEMMSGMEDAVMKECAKLAPPPPVMAPEASALQVQVDALTKKLEKSNRRVRHQRKELRDTDRRRLAVEVSHYQYSEHQRSQLRGCIDTGKVILANAAAMQLLYPSHAPDGLRLVEKEVLERLAVDLRKAGQTVDPPK